MGNMLFFKILLSKIFINRYFECTYVLNHRVTFNVVQRNKLECQLFFLGEGLVN